MESASSLNDIIQGIKSYILNLVSIKVNVGVVDSEGKISYMDPPILPFADFISTFAKENFGLLEVGGHSIPISRQNLVLFKVSDKYMIVLYAASGASGQLLVFKAQASKYLQVFEKLKLETLTLPSGGTKTTLKTIPVLNVKIDFTKKKFPVDEASVLYLIDGKNTLPKIVEETKLPRIRVNEILRKFQKKKWIRIKRVIETAQGDKDTLERSAESKAEDIASEANSDQKSGSVKNLLPIDASKTRTFLDLGKSLADTNSNIASPYSETQTTPPSSLPPIDVTKSRTFIDLERATTEDRSIEKEKIIEIFNPSLPITMPSLETGAQIRTTQPYQKPLPYKEPEETQIPPSQFGVPYYPQNLEIFPIIIEIADIGRYSERDQRVLADCDGRHTIEDLCKMYNIDRISLLKELKKYQKKNILRFFRFLREENQDISQYSTVSTDELVVTNVKDKSEANNIPIELDQTYKELSELVELDEVPSSQQSDLTSEQYEKALSELEHLLKTTETKLNSETGEPVTEEKTNIEELLDDLLDTTEKLLKSDDE